MSPNMIMTQRVRDRKMQREREREREGERERESVENIQGILARRPYGEISIDGDSQQTGP